MTSDAGTSVAQVRALFVSLDDLVREFARVDHRGVAGRYRDFADDDETDPADKLSMMATGWFAELQLRDGFLANGVVPDGRGGAAAEPTRRLAELIRHIATALEPWHEPPWAIRVIGDAPAAGYARVGSVSS